MTKLEFLKKNLGEKPIQDIKKLCDEYYINKTLYPYLDEEIDKEFISSVKKVFSEVVSEQMKHDPEKILELMETEEKSITEILEIIQEE